MILFWSSVLITAYLTCSSLFLRCSVMFNTSSASNLVVVLLISKSFLQKEKKNKELKGKKVTSKNVKYFAVSPRPPLQKRPATSMGYKYPYKLWIEFGWSILGLYSHHPAHAWLPSNCDVAKQMQNWIKIRKTSTYWRY